MAWHEHIALEVAAEFASLDNGRRRREEDYAWNHRKRKDQAWKEHGAWWRKTTAGLAYNRAYSREYSRRTSTQNAGAATCIVCGARFAVSVRRVQRKEVKVCSERCRVRASSLYAPRVVIEGEAHSLAEWCRRQGIKLSTAWARMNRGWDAARAVTTPVCGARPGQTAKRKAARAASSMASPSMGTTIAWPG